MGYRSTVGRLTLDQLIGVRIPVPQPSKLAWEALQEVLVKSKSRLFFHRFIDGETADFLFCILFAYKSSP